MSLGRLLDELDDYAGSRTLVTSQVAGGQFRRWRARARGSIHPLRTVYPFEVVFDIGDDGDWGACVDNTKRLWYRLEGRDVPHIKALSAGKGTHTHVFLADGKWRSPFVVWATARRGAVPKIVSDPLLHEPGENRRMVREFGCVNPKHGRRKTVWPFPVDKLPDDRDRAYAMVGRPIVPLAVDIIADGPGIDMSIVKGALGGLCPQSVECLDRLDYCWHCPVNA